MCRYTMSDFTSQICARDQSSGGDVVYLFSASNENAMLPYTRPQALGKVIVAVEDPAFTLCCL